MKINGIDAVYYFTKDFNRGKAFYVVMIGAEPATSADGYCEWTLPNGESFGLIQGSEFRQGNGILFGNDSEDNGFILHQRK
jgi:hypothetical protein